MAITTQNLFSKKCATPACERRVGQAVEYCCGPCRTLGTLYGESAKGDIHNGACIYAHSISQTIERTFDF